MSLSSLSSLSDSDDEVPQRQIPDRDNLFIKHDGEDFRLRYRISKDTVLQILNILDLEPVTQRNKAIDGLTQLLICLRFFATGSIRQVARDLVNIHKSTICRIIQKVTRDLAKLSSIYIKMPDRYELPRIAEGFYEIGGMPNVAGVLDCTHIKIISRRGTLPEYFRCRDGFISINVQVVCDTFLKIRDIIARWPGSAEDSTIFGNSHLCADFELGRYGTYHLLGDSEYNTQNFLLTPFLQPLTSAEEAYNRSHFATHNTIKRCFRVWKRRSPCLKNGIILNKTSTVLQLIVASAVLHNICIELNDEPPNDFHFNPDTNDSSVLYSSNIPTSVRTALVNTIFS